MKLLITGGCGYVGTKLTQAMLARTGHQVTRPGHAVVRQPPARRSAADHLRRGRPDDR